MEIDEIVNQIIEESGKQLITVKPELRYKIGTEIETIIEGRTCEACDYCEICDNCPVCLNCQEHRLYCQNCDKEEIRRYAIEEGYIDEDEDEDKDINICDICQEYNLYNVIICERCQPCADCNYFQNPEYCPHGDVYEITDNIKQYLDDIYYDESCGMEFVTKPFSSLKDYWKAVKEIVKVVGKENIDISEKCGGHINISWTNGNKSWLDYDTIIASNILFFSDLLSYMFCCNETHWRYTYKEFPSYLETLENDIYDKYNCVHLKDYAIEIRIPDSPKDIDNHVLFSAVLLAISLKTYEIPFDKETFSKTKEIYEKINYHGETLSKEDKSYLKDKFKLLKKFIEKQLKALSHDLGIDLIKALEYRFRYPKYEEFTDSEFNLEQFAIKTKVKVDIIPPTQLTLMAFA